jgi:hypothetical protein
MKHIIQKILKESKEGYSIVYRGQDRNTNGISPNRYIWVTYDIDFAKEYGNYIMRYGLPNNLNILNTDFYSTWEDLVDEFGGEGDYEEYKYQPEDHFIYFLEKNGYDGFVNGDNILIFNKNILKKLD